MILAKKQHESLQMSLLMLFSFSLPLHPRVASWVAFLLTIHWLVGTLSLTNFKKNFQSSAIIFWGFYLIHLLGLFYTTNLAEGYQRIETKLPLLIFPMIFFSTSASQHVNKMLKIFVFGCLLATIYSFTLGIIKNYQTGMNWLFYTNLSGFIGFHPTYFSIYLLFSCFILLSLMMEEWIHFPMRRIMASAVLFWFVVFMLLLSSRMIILLMIVMFNLILIFWMYQNQKLFYGLVISVVTVLFSVSLLLNVPGLKERTYLTINRFKNNNNKTKIDPRINLWSASIELIKSNPLGVGTGDIQDELNKIYQKRNLQTELQYNQNTHNQYLQTTATLGILGGTWLLVLYFLPFYQAFRHKDYLYCLFILLILLAFLTESILQTQRGTMLVGFFHSLFFAKYLGKIQ